MKQFYRFLLSMLKVGCIGFGGGSALIPVIEQEIIEKQEIDTKENYDKDVVVANITPGALPVEIASSLGKRSFGYKGMLLGAVAMAFPGTLAALLLFTVLSTAQNDLLVLVKVMSVGVSAFILYLLADYIGRVLKSCREESSVRFQKAVFLMLGVFVLVCGKNLYRLLGIDRTPLFSVSAIYVLLAAFFFLLCTRVDYDMKKVIPTLLLCGIFLLSHGKMQLIQSEYVICGIEVLMLFVAVFCILQGLIRRRRTLNLNWKGIGKDILVWVIFLLLLTLPAVFLNKKGILFAGEGVVSALMSFGGGDAYLTIAHGLFVDGNMISEEIYYGQIVPVVNILPGSILCKTLAGVGYYMGLEQVGTMLGGICFAAAGFACSVAASSGCFFVIYHLYDSVSSAGVVQKISRWIRPMVAELLGNVMLSLCNQDKAVAVELGVPVWTVLGVVVVLAVADYICSRNYKMKTGILLLLNIFVAGVIFLNPR